MKKKICVITGSRSEYGLLYPLLVKLKTDSQFNLKIIATGMHLSHEFGSTYKLIEKDGFRINEKIEMLLSADNEAGISKSIGLGIIGFAQAFKNIKPNFVILIADRFETFAAAVAAHVARIPIIHLYGGELTVGAIDDAFRHAITKMSYLHFTSTEEYRRRVIQLGEAPNRVFNVGTMGIENIKKLKLLKKEELEKKLNFTFGKRNILVTFHPVTLENDTAKMQFKKLLQALDYFKDVKIIFTKPNADTHGRVIINLIDEYVSSNPERAIGVVSLGTLLYFSTIKAVDVVVGNSSSGIIEVPSFGKPTVNIGDRQEGRIKPGSIIDCEPEVQDIKKAIEKSLSKKMHNLCKKIVNPYDCGYSAQKIIKIIKKNINNLKNIKKTFHNLKVK